MNVWARASDVAKQRAQALNVVSSEAANGLNIEQGY